MLQHNSVFSSLIVEQGREKILWRSSKVSHRYYSRIFYQCIPNNRVRIIHIKQWDSVENSFEPANSIWVGLSPLYGLRLFWSQYNIFFGAIFFSSIIQTFCICELVNWTQFLGGFIFSSKQKLFRSKILVRLG